MPPKKVADTEGQCGRDDLNYNRLDFTYHRNLDLASESSNSPIQQARDRGAGEGQGLARAQNPGPRTLALSFPSGHFLNAYPPSVSLWHAREEELRADYRGRGQNGLRII